MARTEEDMMTGMAAPTPDMPASEPTASQEDTPPMIPMDTLMGNFMDMPQERRDLATRLIASPAAELLDEIIGEPVITRLREQLGDDIPMGDQPPQEEPAAPAEGIMGTGSPASLEEPTI
jgi:hypothetical protein